MNDNFFSKKLPQCFDLSFFYYFYNALANPGQMCVWGLTFKRAAVEPLFFVCDYYSGKNLKRLSTKICKRSSLRYVLINKENE